MIELFPTNNTDFNFHVHVSGYDTTGKIFWLQVFEDPNVVESASATQVLSMLYRYVESANGMMAASGSLLALKPASAATARDPLDLGHPLTTTDDELVAPAGGGAAGRGAAGGVAGGGGARREGAGVGGRVSGPSASSTGRAIASWRERRKSRAIDELTHSGIHVTQKSPLQVPRGRRSPPSRTRPESVAGPEHPPTGAPKQSGGPVNVPI